MNDRMYEIRSSFTDCQHQTSKGHDDANVRMEERAAEKDGDGSTKEEKMSRLLDQSTKLFEFFRVLECSKKSFDEQQRSENSGGKWDNDNKDDAAGMERVTYKMEMMRNTVTTKIVDFLVDSHESLYSFAQLSCRLETKVINKVFFVDDNKESWLTEQDYCCPAKSEEGLRGRFHSELGYFGSTFHDPPPDTLCDRYRHKNRVIEDYARALRQPIVGLKVSLSNSRVATKDLTDLKSFIDKVIAMVV
eukprot:scaffold44974_cov176-Amphora_coffeaeformis.AAC.2